MRLGFYGGHKLRVFRASAVDFHDSEGRVERTVHPPSPHVVSNLYQDVPSRYSFQGEKLTDCRED